MECYYAGIDGNASHSAEVMFDSNSKETFQGLDNFRNTMHYGGSGDLISIPGDLTSTCSTLLLDMVQASQHLAAAALNHGSAEFSGLAATFQKSGCSTYSSSRSLELETDRANLRPLVNSIEYGEMICSRLSSPGINIVQPLRDDRSEKTTLTSTTSKVADDDEAAATGLVMEKLLRDHFQDTSYPSSKTLTTTSSSTKNPQDPSLTVETSQASSSRVELCKMSQLQEQSPSRQTELAQSMVSSSELNTLVRPTFRRPFEVPTGVTEPKIHRKWSHQRPSSTPCGSSSSYQGPYSTSFRVTPSCKDDCKFKTRCTKVADHGLERVSGSRPKRRRTRINRAESSAETQRMTHIAVERNRRKQMNDHLTALKALMPSTFVQKNDQASIIGGAVEFVKELEVLLESLLSKQRRRSSYVGILGPGSWTRFNIHPVGPLLNSTPSYSAAAGFSPPMLNISTTATTSDFDPMGRLQSSGRTIMSSELLAVLPESTRMSNEVKAECRSPAATVEVKVLGNDAIVNITTRRRAKQLVKVIVALERLDLNILHISVTTSNTTVLYTFNAKVGPDCRMAVNHIAAALLQTFNSINYGHLG
ncbi:unnamed protein product [Calypogeia fissa]